VIRSRLRDAAIEAAKAYGHAEVEPRHVWWAAARQYRERPEVAPRLPPLKAALEPRGDALEAPRVGEEAEKLLAGVSTQDDVLTALLAHLGAGPQPEGAGPWAAGAEEAARTTPAVQPAAAAKGPETVAEILEELDRLVGLSPVKTQVRSILAVVQANEERTRAGLAPVSAGLHLVFTGPPGTGKTTVARLVARLYAAAGALAGANFTEVGRADLVAGYVGQTALKTSEVIQRTRPGVLFIDEAYALAPTHASDFGAEAIATLVKAMEDHRGELAVIAAGYGDEMSAFIGSNPGLRSRFKTYVDFPDYAPEELATVFELFAASAGIGLQEGVLEQARRIFAKAALKPDFGNARFARSLFEQAYGRMAARALADGEMTLEELTALAVADLEWQDIAPERGGRPLGFQHRGEAPPR
jgi:hypothetical protein